MSYSPLLEEALDLSTLLSPSNKLVLHNDDVNTFDWVIECLVTHCNHTEEQATQCAFITHYKGKCDVKLGDIDKLKDIRNSLELKGLSVTIETNL